MTHRLIVNSFNAPQLHIEYPLNTMFMHVFLSSVDVISDVFDVFTGYVWLVRQSIEENAKLEIITTSNEDSPFSQGKYPLLVLDMWEHAYYKMHVWNRENYIKNWWPLVDWDNVEEMDGFWRTGKLRENELKQEL